MAVEATRGEMSFDADGKLVDSVYSAVCGGHTQRTTKWSGAECANPSLRGRPDMCCPVKEPPASPSDLKAFLTTEGAYACRLSSFAQLSKFRWEKRFTAKEVDEKLASLRGRQGLRDGRRPNGEYRAARACCRCLAKKGPLNFAGSW